MLTYSTFVGTSPGKYRCLFYLLLDPYLSDNQQLGKELLLLFERFAEDLGTSGAVVKPFQGKLETTSKEVHSKNWTDRQRGHLDRNLPGMLMINVPFDEFDPQTNSWIHLYFGKRLEQGVGGLYDAIPTLKEIAQIIKKRDQDIFASVNAVRRKDVWAGVTDIFEAKLEAKPEVFALSIDLKEAATFVRALHGGEFGMANVQSHSWRLKSSWSKLKQVFGARPRH